jgi:hypothetical protein
MGKTPDNSNRGITGACEPAAARMGWYQLGQDLQGRTGSDGSAFVGWPVESATEITIAVLVQSRRTSVSRSGRPMRQPSLRHSNSSPRRRELATRQLLPSIDLCCLRMEPGVHNSVQPPELRHRASRQQCRWIPPRTRGCWQSYVWHHG